MERFQKLQMALKSQDASLVTWPAHAAGTLEALLMSGDERGHQDPPENYPKSIRKPLKSHLRHFEDQKNTPSLHTASFTRTHPNGRVQSLADP